MTDRYENIRKALAMGPAKGPYWQSEHTPQRVYTQSGAISISWTCNSDNGALEAKAEATAAHIAACDPDTIRELLAERDALAEGLSDTEKDVAVAQAVEFAEYVERQAKGAMREAARRFLSLPYSQEVAERLMERDALERAWGLNQASRDQVADLILTDPDTSEPCHVVSLLRRGPGGFQSFDVQSGPDRTRWRVDVRVSESGSADRAHTKDAIAAANGGSNG